MSRSSYLAIATASLALVLAACAPLEPQRVSTSGGAATPNAGKPTATPAPTFTVGDTVKMGDLEHKLWAARFSSGDQYIKPSQGMRWLVLDVEVTNRGNQTTAISSLLMWKLQDQEHRSANLAIMAGTRGQLDGELGVGRSIRGELAFEVGAAQTTWELIFQPGVFQLGQAIYAVNSTQVKAP